MRLKNLAVSLLALSASTAFAGGDHGSSFQTATAVNNGVIAGRVGTAGDVDYFKLVVRSTSSVSLFTTGDSDTVGTLYDSRFSLVTSNDDASGSQNFRIAQQLTAGTYYLSVKLYNSRALGTYDLRVVGLNSGSIPIPTPRDDHANSTTGATVLAPNSSASGILTAGDVDYFLVNVPQSGRLVIRSTGGTDTFGRLISPSGADLTNDDTNGENFQLTKEVTAGRYFVAVRHYNATGTGNYGITSTFTPAIALTSPSLIAPLNTTVSKDSGSNFSWSSVAGASKYRLVISQNESFTGYSASTGTCSNSTCLVIEPTSPNHFQRSFSLSGQRYYWRVQALNGSSSSGWSRTGTFTTSGAAALPAVNFSSNAYRTDNLFHRAGFAPARFYSNGRSPQLGRAKGNCTWYAHGRLREAGLTLSLNSMTSHAKTWNASARNAGITVNNTPAVGAIAQNTTGGGGYGHVAVVERVNNDGTILISESSYAPGVPSWDFEYRTRTARVSEFPNYIHVRKP